MYYSSVGIYIIYLGSPSTSASGSRYLRQGCPYKSFSGSSYMMRENMSPVVRATPCGDRPKGLAGRGDPKSEYINPESLTKYIPGRGDPKTTNLRISCQGMGDYILR